MEFITRYNQHIFSFRLEHRMSKTTLSEHIWKLKKSEIDHKIKWELQDKARPYSTSTGRSIFSTKGRHSTSDVSCSAHAPTREKVSCRMRNCRIKTLTERERNTCRTLTTETFHHVKMAEKPETELQVQWVDRYNLNNYIDI